MAFSIRLIRYSWWKRKAAAAAAAAAKSLQSCPTLCDPMDGSPPGSPVPGILQARTLEWVAISFSNAWQWKVKVKSLSPWQEYRSGVPSPSPKIYENGVSVLITQSCPILWDPVDCSSLGSSVRGDSPGKNTGVGSHSLLQRIFPIHGLNPGLAVRFFTDWATREAYEDGIIR